MTQDNSVLFALKELQRIETERLDEEARSVKEKQEAAERAVAEARAKAEAETAHAREVAEAEARLRVAQDLAARDADADQRLTRLRAELDAVRAERERMHAEVSRLADDSWTEKRPPRAGAARGWAFAFFSACVAFAGVGAILATREPVVMERIVEVQVEQAPAATMAEPTEAPEAEPTAVAAAPEADETAPERPRIRTRERDRTPRMEDDPLGNLDCPEDDPTCGI